jgi:catalase
LDDRGRAHLIDNIAEHLQQCTSKDIIRRSVGVFANVDEDFGRRLAEKLNIDLQKKVNIYLTFIILNSILLFYCF